ncbi:hypothetical protein [Arthrobacter sp. SDTb3-6]|uniref:hypothetical protein n=1 Tax=Arthrobacter sp. SDTb3-6 TaxID=2713571 RepID=UPI00159D3075|nr:hypothetical protein [Arthrobacter sp. SDTb3-6]NVN00391.1 hypothetical protein [Arthrobacter sp. SDTb3-6]
MALSLSVPVRRVRRYGSLSLITGVYFAFHTMTITAIAVIAPGLADASIAVTIYLGFGLLLDSPAAQLGARYGLRPLVAASGGLIVVTAGTTLMLGSGWWVMVSAAVFATCSSLIYIPTLARYSELLGPAQAAGQRMSVLVQRVGALIASGVIYFTLGRGVNGDLLGGIIIAGAILLASAFTLPHATIHRLPTKPVGPISSMRFSLGEIVRSSTMVRGAVAAASMPIVFAAAGSVLPMALPGMGAAIGIGLAFRELLAMIASRFLGRGSLARTNREFAAAGVVAGVGFCFAAAAGSAIAVVMGLALSGPLIGGAIMASTLNTRQAALASDRPWACFAGMGMAARAGGLAGPLLLGWMLSFGRGALAAAFVLVLLTCAFYVGVGGWPKGRAR